MATITPLSPGGPLATPTVARLVESLVTRGYREVLTAALPPPEQKPFLNNGFSTHHELHLLRLDIEDNGPANLADTRAIRQALRRGRVFDQRAVLEVDRNAFDDFWQFDVTAFRDALTATPLHRFSVDRRRPPMSYHVTGFAGSTGYLQRLAVHESQQGKGLGRLLLSDSLHWLVRRGAHEVFVNTQLGNDAALALYQRFGFQLEPRRLAVLHRSLTMP